MMRVLAFSDVAAPEGGGGVERTLEEIYGRIARRGGAEIHLVTLGGSDLPRAERHNGITVHRASRLPLERITGAQAALSSAVWRLGFRLAARLRPDVIHAHTLFFHSSLVAAAVSRWRRTPLVLTVHVGSMAALPQPYRAAVALYERSLGRLLLRSARRIICVSDDVRDHVIALGADAGRVTMIPNGVDSGRFATAERDGSGVPLLVSVGRLIFNKGQHFLIEAADRLHQEGARFQVVIAGGGPVEQQLHDDVWRRGLEGIVSLPGDEPHVERLLASADAFVRPSLSEGMSLAVLEAVAAGLPVIASDVSGMRALIEDGVSGLIVRPGDVDALTAALRRIIAGRDLRVAMGEAARVRAAGYGWDAVAETTREQFARAA